MDVQIPVGQILCKRCGDALSERKTRARAVYCSTECSTRAAKDRYHEKNPFRPHLMAPAKRGAVSELRVTIDLTERGYEVFKSINPSCSCDIAILKNGSLLRVEVTTGRFTQNGSLIYPKHAKENFDILAVVLPSNEIKYIPDPLPSALPS